LLVVLLLVAAEFATLYQAVIATRSTPIESVTVGSHNSYALIPIALLAAAFGIALRRSGTRLLLSGIGLLGLVALLIALLHDLPDAHAVGLADHNSVNCHHHRRRRPLPGDAGRDPADRSRRARTRARRHPAALCAGAAAGRSEPGRKVSEFCLSRMT
jgi:hypothetical protein